MKKNEVENEKKWSLMAKGDERKRKNEKIMKNDIQIYPTKWHENTDDNENEKNEKNMFDGLRV